MILISLADLFMPPDEDLESAEGPPENALRFKELLVSHDALFVASPEYNSAFSLLLKNALDWASRASEPDEPPLYVYQDKSAGLMSVLDGLRGLVFLKMLLENMGMMVLPAQR